ncbi:MAG: autotransporter outer membrane beta-barrel domain-containing protein [Halarcobacter ebronensis]|uniref:autotransporter family protein n=1 Tax=Halarcobacter ebronensis TaxID=1462615 RepID=UPI003C72E909
MKTTKTKLSLLTSAILFSSVVATQDLQAGTLAVNTASSATLYESNQFYRPSASGTTQTTKLFSYLAQSVYVTTAGTYDFATTGGSVGDPYLLLYSSFDKDNPGDNFIVGNDDGGTGYNALLDDVVLSADTTYYLVTTSYNPETGTVEFLVTGPDGVIITTLTTDQEAASSILNSTISGGGKQPAQDAARVLDSSSGNARMQNVITAINNLSSDSAVAKAVDSTTPQTTTSSFTASNQISNNVSNIVSQRQNVNLNAGGLNSGDEMLSEKNIWVKPYGSKGSQDDKDGVNGFDIDTYGIGFGFDGEYAENKQIGFGFFYTNADVEVNNVSQTSDIDVYSLIVYGNTPIFDNKTNLLYQVGYSWQDTSSNRGIEFMGTSAKADYTSKVASVDLRLLRDYRVNEKLLLQPLVSTTYRHFESPNYSESGADALNLEVDKFTSNELILGVGALGFYKLNENSNLFGNINIGYDLKDDNNIVSSSYQGASGLSFETEGIDNGRFSYDLGIGYENNINDLTNINFSYNFQGEGSDYTNHVISAKYTYKF